uniref:Putative ovule protein n=1 Tax=Solanum chacoense TaxID=4108 RepID=A0A0V0HQU8_SOLCH
MLLLGISNWMFISSIKMLHKFQVKQLSYQLSFLFFSASKRVDSNTYMMTKKKKKVQRIHCSKSTQQLMSCLLNKDKRMSWLNSFTQVKDLF